MNPSDLLSALTWRDALDFGLLFAMIYGVLRFLRGTRGTPVVLAIAVFGVLAWVVRALDLVAVATLLHYVLESTIILVIVVFQPELRRALFYMGQQLLPAGRRQAAASAVEELVSGIERLQRARVGALVILQGEYDVLEVCTNRGVEIDSPLKSEILVALSVPHAVNTAHDGAIVVSNFRIQRAGVICPLSEQQLDRRFGTRHRAAVGSTEETDAFALIVSEERGELRIAEHGVLSDALRITDLEARIAQWLSTPRAEASRSAAEESRADLSRADLRAAEAGEVAKEDSGAISTTVEKKPAAGGNEA